ncbi:hypothetical protein BDR07DRAFT_1491510 [Suillus spraguei]|nr:hypothetical protein BDR07DRAFT_1491510 [Suillus spraguei]
MEAEITENRKHRDTQKPETQVYSKRGNAQIGYGHGWIWIGVDGWIGYVNWIGWVDQICVGWVSGCPWTGFDLDLNDFTHFLNWVYHISSVPPPPEEPFLVTILKVSHLWMISNSIKFAIDGLENLTLHPTHRLELAQLYPIPQWIAPAICEIISQSLTNTTDTKAAQMGFKVYTIIARAKEVMDCSTRLHSRCKEAWSGFWWKKVARAILYPTNPLSLTQTLQFIIEAQLPDGMNVERKQAMVNVMIELDGLEVEEKIIEGVIRAVTSYFNSL